MHNSAHTHHDGSSCLQSQWQAERYTDRTTPQSSDQSRSAMARRRVGLARAVVARNFGRAAVLFPPRKLRASAVPHSQQHRRQKGKEAAEVSASTHARTHASERASERVVFLAASRCCRREHSQPSLDSDEGNVSIAPLASAVAALLRAASQLVLAQDSASRVALLLRHLGIVPVG